MTTTTDVPIVRTGDTSTLENGSTSPKRIESKVVGVEGEGGVSRTTGFRMSLPQQQQRKRKRPNNPAKSPGAAAAAAAAAASSNVFGDDDEDDEKNSRQNLLTMALSRSYSSSDDDEASSLKTSSPNKDMDVESDTNQNPEIRRPQHEMIQTNSSNPSEGNSAHNTLRIQSRDGNNDQKPPHIGTTNVSADSNNGDNTNMKKSQQQPEGWRVKLYRLNADGSWDDCGTGRILCLYKPRPSDGTNGDDNNVPTPNSNPNENDPNSDSAIYIELGEPTLCMHSEVSNSINRNNNSMQQSGINTSGQNNINNNLNNSGNSNPRILLRTRILLRDAYQRQGDNIITWCEPYLEEGNSSQGVDLALSFQDNAGCIDIWRQITQVQSKANEKFRLRQQQQHQQQQQNNNTNSNTSGNTNDGTKTACGVLENNHGRSLADLAHNVAAAHHANFQQQRQELWANAEASQPQNGLVNHNNNNSNETRHAFEDAMGGIVEAYRNAAGGNPGANALGALPLPQLPNPPTVEALEEITDTITTVQHMQQRESLNMFIGQNDCQYLKSLLSLFPPSEAKEDYGSLATLAACVKTILLLNDPSILDVIVENETVFENICAALEYDPDLRDKANHRWFLRERAKFRTVAVMEDEKLVSAIHRSFRVNYLKDTLLRPTMDENSLSTLSSLQTFTHAEVVKGVTMSPVESDDRGDLLRDSYLAKVIRILGHEMDEICNLEWKELETLREGFSGNKDVRFLLAKRQREESLSSSSRDQSTIIQTGTHSQKASTIWKQHLAPQDNSMSSRRIRRRGSLSFLRELFNMVRVSLHQDDKDDFFAVLVSMEVDLTYSKDERNTAKDENMAKNQSSNPVNFLLLLATVLSDPETDVTDKGLVLEIIAVIAMHDPSLIRRKCLDFFASSKNERLARPMTNGKKQVVFQCPPNDLLASLLFLLAMETDAGVLLQVSEIMRIILDTDIMGDNRPMNTGFADEAEGIPPSGGHNPPHDQHPNPNGTGNTTSTEQNQFLSAFYEHYVYWLAAPFQFTILYPLLRVPTEIFHGTRKSDILQAMIRRFQKGEYHEEPLLHRVPFSALRSSFAVELLSFCVRAHQYRMNAYLLRSRLLGEVLRMIQPSAPRNSSVDRCLKLAALRFLRAVLSVDEDSYNSHIIKDDLFGPVFEAFRANPVGDNLVSSSIVEMCDFINSKNMNSLIEYIVTKHILVTGSDAPVPSLEDVSSPYVSTLACLRHAYETLDRERKAQNISNQSLAGSENTAISNMQRVNPVVTNEKALEDQRKFRQAGQEESYFDCDDDDEEGTSVRTSTIDPNTVINPLPVTQPGGQQQLANELNKTPHMFTLSKAENEQSNSGGPCL